MLSQRVGARALRQGAVKPSVFFSQNAPKLAMASGISTTQSRPVATTKASQQEGYGILVKQRMNRPVAPHLGIYKMGQTWFSDSAWTRITGCTLSGAAYLYFTAYLGAPLLGWHLESASMASAFASMPFLLKGGIKFFLGFPFSYHFINGIRHIVNDFGVGFTKPQINQSKYLIWSVSGLAAAYLAFGL